MTIKTKRLHLRSWKKEDLDSFAALNADPRVMEYYPSILNRVDSDALADRISTHIDELGWGLWAVSVPGISEFIGIIGLVDATSPTSPRPVVEVSWRLAHEFWGQGYATEGAIAVIKYAHEILGFKEIISFTASENIRSIQVMQKIGMQHNPEEDSEHPCYQRYKFFF